MNTTAPIAAFLQLSPVMPVVTIEDDKSVTVVETPGATPNHYKWNGYEFLPAK